MAGKLKKVMSRKHRGVKTLVSGGTEPGSVSSIGKGRGAARLFPEPVCNPEDVGLLDDHFETADSEDKNAGGAVSLSRYSTEIKSDQLALSTVTPPKESLIPGDITYLVTNVTVMTQGPSPVPHWALRWIVTYFLLRAHRWLCHWAQTTIQGHVWR